MTCNNEKSIMQIIKRACNLIFYLCMGCIWCILLKDGSDPLGKLVVCVTAAPPLPIRVKGPHVPGAAVFPRASALSLGTVGKSIKCCIGLFPHKSPSTLKK